MNLDPENPNIVKAGVLEARENLFRVFEGMAATRTAIEACAEGTFPTHTLFTASDGNFVDKPTREEIIATLKEHPEEILQLDAENGVIKLKGVHQSARRRSLDKKRINFAETGTVRRTSDSSMQGMTVRRSSDPSAAVPDTLDEEDDEEKGQVIRIPHRNTVSNVRKEYRIVGHGASEI